MTHTPGPWIVHGGWGGMVKAANGKFVAECRNRQLNPEEIEANMTLIAASPKLLSACEQALMLLGTDEESENGCGSPEEVAHDLREAIKKARGE